MPALQDFSNDIVTQRKAVRAEKMGVKAGTIPLLGLPWPEVVAWLVHFWQGELFGFLPCVEWDLVVIVMVLIKAVGNPGRC